MSRRTALGIRRQRYTVVFAQTVFHSVSVAADSEEAAIETAADQYESDERLFPNTRLPRPWRRWWGSYEIEDSLPAPLRTPSKGEAS